MDAAGYLEQSRVTDPGPWRPALELQSADVAWLRGLVPGLVIHAGMGDLYGADLGARLGEARLRTVSGMLERLLQLDPRPLMTARNPGTRLVGNCRQSSVLYCAMLRLARIPARVRAGFSAYFTSPIRGDHWVTERWDTGAGNWVLADPELDDRLMAENGIDFDPDDLPRDRFILAGQAWLACRAGDEDADGYGLNPQVTGLGYIRAQLLRDLAALNRVEVGPWDAWGDGVDPELLDAVSRATTDGAPSPAAALWAAHAELRPPHRFTVDPEATATGSSRA